MTRVSLLAFFAVAALRAPDARAQSLSRRIADAGDGIVVFSFASRPGVCGDGETYVRDGFGNGMRISERGNFSGRDHGNDDWPPCIPGPVHVRATLSQGEVIRLRTFAGPLRDRDTGERRDLGTVGVGEATAYLTRLVEQANGRTASDAVLPIVLADSIDPWPTLLRFARDERLSRSIRSSVNFWLARGASAALGVADHDDDPDDDVRGSAVFALSQQPKDIAIPRLLEVARRNTHPAARSQALFWLGQSNDPRAVDLFEDILRRR
jgi:hypothetical protein